MILDTVTRSLQLALGEPIATADCDIVACFATSSRAGFVTGAAQLSSNGTAPVTVVPAPLLGAQCQVNEIRLHNSDTVPHSLTLSFVDGSTVRTILAGVVGAGGDWLYAPSLRSDTAPSSALALTLGWGGTQAVTAGTFQFTGSAAYPFVITGLEAAVGNNGGSIVADVRNAGVSVAGLDAATINTAARVTFAPSGAGAFVAANAVVDVVLAITGSPVAAFLTLRGVKI